MARPAAIRQDEVWAAIGQLVSEGRTPTHVSIRTLTDGRGSPVVIQRYLDEWFEAYGGLLTQLLAGMPPGEVIEAKRMEDQLESFAKANMARIHAESRRQQDLIDERSASLAALEQLLAQRQRDLEERDRARHEIVEAIRADIAAVVEAKGALRAELAVAEATAQALRDRIEQLQGVLADQEVLERDLAGVREELEVTRAHVARADARVVELVAERDHHQAQSAHHAAAQAATAAQLATAQAALTQAQAELAHEHQRVGESAAALATSQALAAAAAGERDRAVEEKGHAADRSEALLREAMAREDEARRRVAEVELENVRLVGRLSGREAEAKGMQTVLARLQELQAEVVRQGAETGVRKRKTKSANEP